MSRAATKRTVLLTWELGGELGHLACLSSISQAFVRQGFTVVLALKDLSNAHIFFPVGSGVTLIQAPVWLPNPPSNKQINSLADVLLLKGYSQPEAIRTLHDAWQALFILVQPDLLICKYSPTAMLASYVIDLPRIIVGEGFAEPIPGMPLLNWHHGTFNDSNVIHQEQQLLNNIHAAVGNTLQFECYADIYHCDATFIRTFPQLDCYAPHRQQVSYGINRVSTHTDRIPPKWNDSDAPKILACLKPHYPHLDTALQALEACDGNVFIDCPGGDPSRFAAYVSPTFSFSTDFVDLESAFQEADVFVGHGNMGTMTESLSAGIPVATLPIHLENASNGRLAQHTGAGILFDQPITTNALQGWFNDLLNNKILKANAEALASQCHNILQKPIHESIFETSMGLLR